MNADKAITLSFIARIRAFGHRWRTDLRSSFLIGGKKHLLRQSHRALGAMQMRLPLCWEAVLVGLVAGMAPASDRHDEGGSFVTDSRCFRRIVIGGALWMPLSTASAAM
ncbi:MAG TPA: hypothetical protein DDZ81_00395 [Acetobacteraceae bacterium]|nr:hypothetical protein [Acetobacteraceae bacterium]